VRLCARVVASRWSLLYGGIPRGAGHLDTLVADLFADLVATVRQQEAATETGQEGEPR
jgi:hypothetical protein